MKIWRWFVSICLISLLAACAGPAIDLAGDSGTFMRTGRFAVNYQSNLEKPFAAQGNFSWLDSGNELKIDLSSPLGSIIARILLKPNQSIINYADGSSDTASSPDELLARIWGQAIPVSGLKYWIRGDLYPHTAANNEKYKGSQLIGFEQLGWQVALADYDSQGPKKISLKRSDTQSRLLLKFVVN